MLGFIEIICGAIILLFTLYRYYTYKYGFWKKRGIPGPTPIPIFGTTKDITLQKISMSQYIKNIYDTYKHVPMVGIFDRWKPILIVIDPVLIKNILITEGILFSNRETIYSKKAEPTMDNLFFMEYERSQHIRAKISPLFTPRKIKSMFPLLLQRLEVFKDWLDTLLLQNEQINCSMLMERLTVDLATICLFSYDTKIIGDGENKILERIKYVQKDNWKNKIQRVLVEEAKQLFDLIGYYLFRNDKTTNIYTCFFTDILKYREKHGIVRHDAIDVLMKLKENPGKLAEKIGKITDEFMIAQFSALFVAAYETSAATTTNALYELALNQTVQDRLREEIRNIYAKHDGELTIEDLNEMPYTDAVLKETLRKYPLAQIIKRRSTINYMFKDIQVSIPKDQLIFIPAQAIHYDPEIYSNPEIFDPERFLNDATLSKQAARYMPFGHGPRNCVGEQLGILEVKVVLITVLHNYKIDICEKTQIPYVYSPQLYVQQSEGIYLKMTKIV